MSLGYCFYCLIRFDACECKRCDGGCRKIIYGEKRVAYQQGYRDAKNGEVNEEEE